MVLRLCTVNSGEAEAAPEYQKYIIVCQGKMRGVSAGVSHGVRFVGASVEASLLQNPCVHVCFANLSS